MTAKVVAADGLTSELFYQIAGRHASVLPPCPPKEGDSSAAALSRTC
jgi:hypothetical protein